MRKSEQVTKSVAVAVAESTQRALDRAAREALDSAHRRVEDAERALARGEYGRVITELTRVAVDAGLGRLAAALAEAREWRGIVEARERVTEED